MKLKAFFVLLGMSILLYGCGSDKPDKLPSSNQKKSVKKDSSDNAEPDLIEYKGLPINKDSAEIIYTGGTEKDRQFVFIDKRKKSEYYDLIVNIELSSKFETSQYRDSYKQILKKYTENFETSKIDPINLPKQWIELKCYSHEYYVYCPAREESNFRISINDSALMIFDLLGVNAEKISGFEKTDEKHYVINTVCISDQSKLISKETNIYLINNDKHIYIWEIFAPSGITYKLMIPVNYARKFPIIINYGEKSKPEEFEFSEINYFEEINKLI